MYSVIPKTRSWSGFGWAWVVVWREVVEPNTHGRGVVYIFQGVRTEEKVNQAPMARTANWRLLFSTTFFSRPTINSMNFRAWKTNFLHSMTLLKVFNEPYETWSYRVSWQSFCFALIVNSRFYVACSGLPAVLRKKNFPESHIINPLLTKLVQSRWLDIGP